MPAHHRRDATAWQQDARPADHDGRDPASEQPDAAYSETAADPRPAAMDDPDGESVLGWLAQGDGHGDPFEVFDDDVPARPVSGYGVSDPGASDPGASDRGDSARRGSLLGLFDEPADPTAADVAAADDAAGWFDRDEDPDDDPAAAHDSAHEAAHEAVHDAAGEDDPDQPREQHSYWDQQDRAPQGGYPDEREAGHGTRAQHDYWDQPRHPGGSDQWDERDTAAPAGSWGQHDGWNRRDPWGEQPAPAAPVSEPEPPASAPTGWAWRQRETDRPAETDGWEDEPTGHYDVAAEENTGQHWPAPDARPAWDDEPTGQYDAAAGVRHDWPADEPTHGSHNRQGADPDRTAMYRNSYLSDWAEEERSDWAEEERSDWAETQRSDWAEGQRSDWAEGQRSDWAEGERSDWAEEERGPAPVPTSAEAAHPSPPPSVYTAAAGRTDAAPRRTDAVPRRTTADPRRTDATPRRTSAAAAGRPSRTARRAAERAAQNRPAGRRGAAGSAKESTRIPRSLTVSVIVLLVVGLGALSARWYLLGPAQAEGGVGRPAAAQSPASTGPTGQGFQQPLGSSAHLAKASTRPSPSKSTVPPPPAVPHTIATAQDQVVQLVNAEREKAGCAAMHTDNRLIAAAQKHSADMANRNYFSHTNPEGQDFAARITAEGYDQPGGENIAAGQSSAEQVMAAWMESSGHKANILNCNFKAIGVGLGTGGEYGHYWTQDFGYE